MEGVDDEPISAADMALVDQDATAAEALGRPFSSAELREKIKEIKKQKEELARKEDLEKEIRRREDGKAMLEVARKNAELKQKLEIEQQRKQREADVQYKKRLLEELERDKEHRKAMKNPVAAASQATSKPSAIPTVNSDECRICFQFPDGKRINAVFPSIAKFQEVYDHIAHNNLFEGNYELHRTYPRGPIKDFDKNLIELQLTPATLLAVCKLTTTQALVLSRTQEIVKSIFYLLLTIISCPLLTARDFIASFFGNNIQKTDGETGSSRVVERKKKERKDHDSDDEGTWNGNSTQQL